jgi:hypothetical protein
MSLHVLHDVSWEYGSDWCFGLRKDEELLIYEGWHFCKEKGRFLGEEDRRRAKYSEACLCLWELIEGVM